MKPLLLIALLLLANTVAAAEPISRPFTGELDASADAKSGKKYSQSEPSTKQEFTAEKIDAEIRAAEKSRGMAPSGNTTTKRRYTTEELDAMQEAEQTRRAAEEQRGRLAKERAQFAIDNYACLMEYRTSAPVTQPPLGSSMEAVIMQGSIEQGRENKYVRACLESKGWTFPAHNAESTK